MPKRSKLRNVPLMRVELSSLLRSHPSPSFLSIQHPAFQLPNPFPDFSFHTGWVPIGSNLIFPLPLTRCSLNRFRTSDFSSPHVFPVLIQVTLGDLGDSDSAICLSSSNGSPPFYIHLIAIAGYPVPMSVPRLAWRWTKAPSPAGTSRISCGSGLRHCLHHWRTRDRAAHGLLRPHVR